jgi:hypothetical protein
MRLGKELLEVERSFANLEDIIDMRLIYHRSDHRVETHIFVAAIAFSSIAPSKRSSRPHASIFRSIDGS